MSIASPLPTGCSASTPSITGGILAPMVKNGTTSFWCVDECDRGFLVKTLTPTVYPQIPFDESKGSLIYLSSVTDTLCRDINILCNKLGLKYSTRHLALLIGQRYLGSLDSIGSMMRARETAQTSVLIAAKIREKDLDCPPISVVAKSGRQISTTNEIKTTEILINNKFQWNFVFKTPYDYLEMFLTIGLLLETDSVVAPSLNSSPASDKRGTKAQARESKVELGYASYHSAGTEAEGHEGVAKEKSLKVFDPRYSPHGSQDNILRGFVKNPTAGGNSKRRSNIFTPSPFSGLVNVAKMDPEEQTETRRDIRTLATTLIDFVSNSCQCSPLHHKVIAYSCIAYARKLHGISDYDSPYLRAHYHMPDTRQLTEQVLTVFEFFDVNFRERSVPIKLPQTSAGVAMKIPVEKQTKLSPTHRGDKTAAATHISPVNFNLASSTQNEVKPSVEPPGTIEPLTGKELHNTQSLHEHKVPVAYKKEELNKIVDRIVTKHSDKLAAKYSSTPVLAQEMDGTSSAWGSYLYGYHALKKKTSDQDSSQNKDDNSKIGDFHGWRPMTLRTPYDTIEEVSEVCTSQTEQLKTLSIIVNSSVVSVNKISNPASTLTVPVNYPQRETASLQDFSKERQLRNSRETGNRAKAGEVIEKHIRSINHLKQNSQKYVLSKTVSSEIEPFAERPNSGVAAHTNKNEELPKSAKKSTDQSKLLSTSKVEINIPSSRYFNPVSYSASKSSPTKGEDSPSKDLVLQITEAPIEVKMVSHVPSASKRSHPDQGIAKKDKEMQSPSKDYYPVPRSATSVDTRQSMLLSSKNYNSLAGLGILKSQLLQGGSGLTSANPAVGYLRESVENKYDPAEATARFISPETRPTTTGGMIAGSKISSSLFNPSSSLNHRDNQSSSVSKETTELYSSIKDSSKSRYILDKERDALRDRIANLASKISEVEEEHLGKLNTKDDIQWSEGLTFKNLGNSRYSPQKDLAILEEKEGREERYYQSRNRGTTMPLSTTAADRTKNRYERAFQPGGYERVNMAIPYQRRLSRDGFTAGVTDNLNTSIKKSIICIMGDTPHPLKTEIGGSLGPREGEVAHSKEERSKETNILSRYDKKTDNISSSSLNIASKFVGMQGAPYIKSKYDHYLPTKREPSSVLHATQKRSQIESTLGILKHSRGLVGNPNSSSFIKGTLNDYKSKTTTVSNSAATRTISSQYQAIGLGDRKKTSIGANTSSSGTTSDLIIKRQLAVTDQPRRGPTKY